MVGQQLRATIKTLYPLGTGWGLCHEKPLAEGMQAHTCKRLASKVGLPPVCRDSSEETDCTNMSCGVCTKDEKENPKHSLVATATWVKGCHCFMIMSELFMD